jgi:streptogramin lyase
VRISWTMVLISCALALSGCSGMPGIVPSSTDPTPVGGVAIAGIVHGGQQPIWGGHVYLYAANTTGYGNGSVSVLASVSGSTTKDANGNYYVTTAQDGTFSITSDFTCPSSSSQVYLYAVGGNSLGQDPSTGTNLGAGLLASLGTCDSLTSSVYAVVNEISTIATAYSIAGFATDATHVSSSGSALAEAGATNAFGATVNNGVATGTVASLETLSTGLPLATTPSGNGTVPVAEIDTLADILAACINTSSSSSMPCGTLFSNATNGEVIPTDTATAAINIAHNPGNNVAALFALQTGTPPFQPTLSVAPNDFTLSISYTGGGLDGSGFAPEGIAVDGSGTIWVTNYTHNSVSLFGPVGNPISGTKGDTATGLDGPTSIAIDVYGNAWVVNYSSASVTNFNPQGQPLDLPPPYYTDAGLNVPYGVTVDPTDHIWIANLGGNTMSEFQENGVAVSPSSGFTSNDLIGPAGIASDASGNIWTANYLASTGSIVEASPSTLPGVVTPTITVFTGGGLNSPYGIAVDSSGNVWVTNRGGSGSVSGFNSSGQPLPSSPFSGGGVNTPYGIAIDGADNIWTANYGGNSNSVSEFNSGGTAISGVNGYVGIGLLLPYGIAIDSSGNVWVANQYAKSPLTEFVGAAAPVVTPLSAAVEYKELGTRP